MSLPEVGKHNKMNGKPSGQLKILVSEGAFTRQHLLQDVSVMQRVSMCTHRKHAQKVMISQTD